MKIQKEFWPGLGICLAATVVSYMLWSLAGAHWALATAFLFATMSNGLRRATRTQHLQPRWADDMTHLTYAGVLLNLLYIWIVQPLGIEPTTETQHTALGILCACIVGYVVVSLIDKHMPEDLFKEGVLVRMGYLVGFFWATLAIIALWITEIAVSAGDVYGILLASGCIIILSAIAFILQWWISSGDLYEIRLLKYMLAERMGGRTLHSDVYILNTAELRNWLNTADHPFTDALRMLDAVRTLVTWGGRYRQNEQYILPILGRIVPISRPETLQHLLDAADECIRISNSDEKPPLYWDDLTQARLYEWIHDDICYGPSDDTLPGVGQLLMFAELRHNLKSTRRIEKSVQTLFIILYCLPLLVAKTSMAGLLLSGTDRLTAFIISLLVSIGTGWYITRLVGMTNAALRWITPLLLCLPFCIAEVVLLFIQPSLAVQFWTIDIALFATLLLYTATFIVAIRRKDAKSISLIRASSYIVGTIAIVLFMAAAMMVPTIVTIQMDSTMLVDQGDRWFILAAGMNILGMIIGLLLLTLSILTRSYPSSTDEIQE